MMKYLAVYAASAVGFTAAMALHAYGEKDPKARRAKKRAIALTPVWPAYLAVAVYQITKNK